MLSREESLLSLMKISILAMRIGGVMINKINEELRQLNDVKSKIENGIKNVPEGKLRCSTSNGCYQYYCQNRYIKLKDKEVAIKLANKEYLTALDKELRIYEKLILKMKDFYEKKSLQKIYMKLNPARKVLVTPLYRPVEDIIAEFENKT